MSEVFSSVPEFVAEPCQAPKPCQFCQQFPLYNPLEEMEHYGVKIFFCHTCKAEYLYWRTNQNYSSVSLYTEIQGKMYRWTYRTQGYSQLWWVKNPGIPGTRRNRDLQSILHVSPEEGIPDITPANINSRVRTWLLFL